MPYETTNYDEWFHSDDNDYGEIAQQVIQLDVDAKVLLAKSEQLGREIAAVNTSFSQVAD